jgi:predicted O-methyltransferase YrrM
LPIFNKKKFFSSTIEIKAENNTKVFDPKGPLPLDFVLPELVFDEASRFNIANNFTSSSAVTAWYPPISIGAPQIGNWILESTPILTSKALKVLELLEEDDYSRYLQEYYKHGLQTYQEKWRYADLLTTIIGLFEFFMPSNYLEIGVRRGRSLCGAVSVNPNLEIFAFDIWQKNYAGMENPGPPLILSELSKLEYNGNITFVEGNSHSTLKEFKAKNPKKYFDVITVDGDHTNLGAAEDISDVCKLLSVGGLLVFDDISHPKLPGLRDVWRRLIVENPRFSTWSFPDLGYGIAIAIRRW